jgi:predicted PurR-regulated permease PerM
LSVVAAFAWRFLVIVGALVVLVAAFERLALVVLPVIVALFLAAILVPPARWLQRHRWPATAATWAVFLGALICVVGGATLVIRPVADQLPALGHTISQGADRLQRWLIDGPLHLSPDEVHSNVDRLRAEFGARGGTLVRGVVAGASLLVEVVAATLLTAVLTFFFVKDGDDITNWIVGLVPEQHQGRVRAIGRVSWETLGGYLRGTAVNGAVNAILLAIGLILLRVPLVAPITLLTFVGGFIPLVGAIVSGALAAVVALVTRSPATAVVVVGLTVVIHNVEGYLVGPLVLGRAVHLHPVAILLALTTGTVIAGVIGTFLAVPTLAVGLGIISQMRGGAAVVAPAGAEALRTLEPRDVPRRTAPN